MQQTQKAAGLAVKAWHTLPGSRVSEALDTPAEGLSSVEAARRLSEFGPNQLRVAPPPPPWRILLRQVMNPIIYVLFGVALVSWLLGEEIDSIVILGIVFLNSAIGFIQEFRAQQAIQALAQMTSPRATVVRDGEEIVIPASEVVPGDLLRLTAGDRTAADARILHAGDLEIDESALTGESVPSLKHPEPLGETALPLADRRNMAFMNTSVTRGRGLAVVVATGMATEMGKIAGALASPTMDPLRRKMQTLSHRLGLLVLVLMLAAIVIGLVRGFPFLEIFRYAMGMAASAIPEGLPLVVTLLLAVGVWRMAQRNALIRNLPAIEALGAVTAICTDKTGTLTRNMMTVRRVSMPARAYEVTGEGYCPEGEIRPMSPASRQPDRGLAMLLEAARYCNDADLRERDGVWEVLGDPTEGALLTLSEKGGVVAEADRLAEISFSSERRWMATLNRLPDGRTVAYAKGALERILPMAHGWLDPDGQVRPLGASEREAVLREADAMASQALRILAFAYVLESGMEQGFDAFGLDGCLIFLGVTGMIDPPRPEAIAAIQTCHEAGIQVAMITGDHRETALAIAREMHLWTSGREALTGAELMDLSDSQLRARAPGIAVYARVEPEHKLRIVRSLQELENIVAMTGDGVNDAPALARADVGISMGLTGTEVAKEASDMVLADDNFATIVAAVAEGRRIGENLRKVLRYLFATSTGEAMTFMTAIVLGTPLPLLPIQIIWLNVITDGSFDKSLAMEPAESDLMRRPPRPAKAPLLGWEVLAPVLMVAPVMMLGTFLVFLHALDVGLALEKAQTMAFSTLAFFQWFSAFSLRSLTRPLLRLPVNRWMFLSLTISIALHLGVLYHPALQRIFHTVSLTPSELAVTFVVASSLLVFLEGRKYLWEAYLRHRSRR
ncbi:Calcium-transporting ATPase [compost metagenome]